VARFSPRQSTHGAVFFSLCLFPSCRKTILALLAQMMASLFTLQMQKQTLETQQRMIRNELDLQAPGGPKTNWTKSEARASTRRPGMARSAAAAN
jgi:flagellar biosynthesis component FlhA